MKPFGLSRLVEEGEESLPVTEHVRMVSKRLEYQGLGSCRVCGVVLKDISGALDGARACPVE